MRLRSAGLIFFILAFADFFPMREKYADSFLSIISNTVMLNGWAVNRGYSVGDELALLPTQESAGYDSGDGNPDAFAE